MQNEYYCCSVERIKLCVIVYPISVVLPIHPLTVIVLMYSAAENKQFVKAHGNG